MLDEEYLTAREIMQQFKVTRATIYRWIAEGKLRAIRIGGAVRISRSALEDFVKPIEPLEIDLRTLEEKDEA